MRHTFSENIRERKAQNVQEQSEQDASVNMLRQTVKLATAILLFHTIIYGIVIQHFYTEERVRLIKTLGFIHLLKTS